MSRRLLACTAVTGLLAGTLATVHALSPAADQRAAQRAAERVAAESGDAARFLRITGGTSSGPTAVRQEVEAAAGAAAPADACEKSPATVATLPNGWCLSPAGSSVEVLRFPLGITPTSNGKVVVTSNSGGVQGLSVIDQATLASSQTTGANLFMGLAETADHRVFAAGGNANRVFRYRFAGDTLQSQDLTQDATFPLHTAIDGVAGRVGAGTQVLPAVDGIRVTSYPGTLATAGAYVIAAGTLSEASTACSGKRPACGYVSVIDSTTDTVVGRAPVGLDPIGLAVDRVRKLVYVTNWADEAGRGAGVGTVSVVSIANPAKPVELMWLRVGHHPSAIVLSPDRKRLFVANTNDDSISVLDVSRRPRVVATQSVRPVAGVPVGAHPDALALSPDGRTLFVALAGMNAVEVRDGRTAARVAGHPMYIPTGWYPSALAVTGTAAKYRLWITNAKGIGPSMGYNGSVLAQGTTTNGTVSVVDLPAPARVANAWTASVVRNDSLDEAAVSPCTPGRGVRISTVLCPPRGKRSPLKHMVFVVTENKTFDQYFGDLPATDGGYDADPSFTIYGEPVTPNHHKLAGPYSLGDSFYSDAEVSVTGHSWTSGAVATDYNERTWPADYDEGIRGNHGNGDPLKGSLAGPQGAAIQAGEDELYDPEGGFVFEAFKRAGATPPSDRPGRLSMAIYGESTSKAAGKTMDAFKAPGWKDGDIAYSDTCRVLTFRDGQAPDGPSPAFAVGSPPAGVAAGDCDGRKLAPAFTLKHWTEVYKKTGRDIMPSFLYISLPQNHTLGTTVGAPTPQSMVADNDYAVGLLVDALSHSPFWGSTAVLQTEDDTQVAGDHVSALRDYLQVSSPWAQPGPNHQYGSMPSVLRTIEQVLGVAPISLFDRLAMPMHEAFLPSLSNKPNLTPYTAVKAAVPFRLNEPGAPGARESSLMDFSTYDLVDEQLLNAILYADARRLPLVLPDR
ncbi:MAG TPA: bifunctional YncE family protein/alkaline phosphatase family protein [Mycobacteriales bacterium]|nr:bifunctional YncE family protein/alkaline phosphatase family protein [Mycobacteriales bacterium]